MILQDAVQLTLSIQLQNYKNYIARLETLGQAINRPHHFWKNLFAISQTCKTFIERTERLYIGLYDKLQNIFLIDDNSFQREPKQIATPYILQKH